MQVELVFDQNLSFSSSKIEMKKNGVSVINLKGSQALKRQIHAT